MRTLPTTVALAAAAVLLASCSSSKSAKEFIPSGVPGESTPAAATIPAVAPSSAGPTVPFAVREDQAWYLAVKPGLDTLQGDAQAMSTAVQTATVTDIRAGCAALQSVLVSVRADPPAPDADLAADLAGIVQDYGRAATDCAETALSDTLADLTSGAAYRSKLDARITSLG